MALFGIDIKDLGSAVASVGSVAKDLRAAITGKSVIDPTAQAQIELGIQQLEAQTMTAQAEINKVEASSTSLFVSGWRPFLGWVCALGFAAAFLVTPVLGAFGIVMPKLDTATLGTMLAGMLGLVTMRTVEKAKGVARN